MQEQIPSIAIEYSGQCPEEQIKGYYYKATKYVSQTHMPELLKFE